MLICNGRLAKPHADLPLARQLALVVHYSPRQGALGELQKRRAVPGHVQFLVTCAAAGLHGIAVQQERAVPHHSREDLGMMVIFKIRSNVTLMVFTMPSTRRTVFSAIPIDW